MKIVFSFFIFFFLYFQMKMMMVVRNVNICESQTIFSLTKKKKRKNIVYEDYFKRKENFLEFRHFSQKKIILFLFFIFLFRSAVFFPWARKLSIQYEFFILIKWIKLLFSLLESFSFISYFFFSFILPLPCSFSAIACEFASSNKTVKKKIWPFRGGRKWIKIQLNCRIVV